MQRSCWDRRPSGFMRRSMQQWEKKGEIIGSGSYHPVLYLVHVLIVFAVFFCWKDSLGRINHGADYDSVKQQCLQNLIFPEPKIWMWNNSQFSQPVSWLKRVWIFKVAKNSRPPFFKAKHRSHSHFQTAQPTSQPWIHCFTAPVHSSNSSPESSPGVRGVWCQSLWVSWLKSYGLVCFFIAVEVLIGLTLYNLNWEWTKIHPRAWKNWAPEYHGPWQTPEWMYATNRTATAKRWWLVSTPCQMQRGAGFPRGPETRYFPPFFLALWHLGCLVCVLNESPICMCFLSDSGAWKSARNWAAFCIYRSGCCGCRQLPKLHVWRPSKRVWFSFWPRYSRICNAWQDELTTFFLSHLWPATWHALCDWSGSQEVWFVSICQMGKEWWKRQNSELVDDSVDAHSPIF